MFTDVRALKREAWLQKGSTCMPFSVTSLIRGELHC